MILILTFNVCVCVCVYFEYQLELRHGSLLPCWLVHLLLSRFVGS